MRRLPAVLLSCSLLAAALPAAAQQWQWRDAGGRLHASDLPPPREVPDKDILKRPAAPPPRAVMPFGAAEPPAAPASRAAASASAPDPQARRKAEQGQATARQQEQLQQQQQQAALRADNCRRAQEQWRTLESGMRLARINERGERVPMDDAQRAEEVQRARAAIEQNCR